MHIRQRLQLSPAPLGLRPLAWDEAHDCQLVLVVETLSFRLRAILVRQLSVEQTRTNPRRLLEQPDGVLQALLAEEYGKQLVKCNPTGDRHRTTGVPVLAMARRRRTTSTSNPCQNLCPKLVVFLHPLPLWGNQLKAVPSANLRSQVSRPLQVQP